MNEHDNEWNDQKYEFQHLSLALLDLTVEKYDNDWLNEWMNEWMNRWMNMIMNEWMNMIMNEWMNMIMNEWTW